MWESFSSRAALCEARSSALGALGDVGNVDGKVAEVGDVTEAGRGGRGMAGGGDGNVVMDVLLRRLDAEEVVRSGDCMLSRICDCHTISI